MVRKLAFCVAIFLSSNLFAAAATEWDTLSSSASLVQTSFLDIPDEVIQAHILRHLRAAERLALSFVNKRMNSLVFPKTTVFFNMRTVQEKDVAHVETFFRNRQDAQKLKIREMNFSVLERALTNLQTSNFIFEKMTELDISLNSQIPVSILYLFTHLMPNLTILKAACCTLQEGEAASISRMEKLLYLDIGNNYIKDTGAKFISRLKAVVVLNVFDNFIGDEGMTSISGMSQLKFLSMGCNKADMAVDSEDEEDGGKLGIDFMKKNLPQTYITVNIGMHRVPDLSQLMNF
jgi:hypothetical protein